jgi:hypothetical protein
VRARVGVDGEEAERRGAQHLQTENVAADAARMAGTEQN